MTTRAFDAWEVDNIRQLRENDPKLWTNEALAIRFNVSTTTIRRVLGLRFESGRTYQPIGYQACARKRIEADARRLARQIPPDDRSLTGRICGDPLSSRSALASLVKRKEQQPTP